MKKLLQQFDLLSEEYRTLISDRFSPEDFREYNEVLFSARPLVTLFLQTSIDRMQEEIQSKKNATQNFLHGWQSLQINS